MENPGWKTMLIIGERLREQGHNDAAIKNLAAALKAASLGVQKAEVLAQLGLCYEHDGNFDEAERLYNEGLRHLEDPEGDEGFAEMARLKRHLSSLKLKIGETDEAVLLAGDAVNLMNTLDAIPNDMAWVIHGFVKCLKAMGKPKKDIRYWVKLEGSEIHRSWSKEENKIRKYVWLTGYLGDLAYAWAPWSWGFYVLAYLISWFKGLKLRMRQVDPKRR